MNLTTKLLLTATMIWTVPGSYAQSKNPSGEDETFLKNSTQDGLAQIKMARLALKTSNNPTVTTFAKKMLDDREKLLEEEKPIALKAGLSLPGGPSSDGDAECLKLQGLSGDAFDRSFIKSLANEHHKDLEAAKVEHLRTQNEDMRKLAARAQEAIAIDVEMVDQIAAKMGE
jgi:putative membrane protein